MQARTHRFFGLLAGAAIVFSARTLHIDHALPAAAVAGAYLGSTAPDWLEISRRDRLGKRHSLIPHRTITHWALGWIVLTGLCAAHLGQGIAPTALFGFCSAALLHVLMDATTPMGVPILHPWRRASIGGIGSAAGARRRLTLSMGPDN